MDETELNTPQRPALRRLPPVERWAAVWHLVDVVDQSKDPMVWITWRAAAGPDAGRFSLIGLASGLGSSGDHLVVKRYDDGDRLHTISVTLLGSITRTKP